MGGISRKGMFWRLVLQALRQRKARVGVIFTALAVGAAIVAAMAAVYFDINAKMSRELRAFGANLYIGPAQGGSMAQSDLDAVLAQAPAGLVVTVCPFLYGSARTELENVALAGVDFSALRELNSFWQVTGSWVAVDFDDRNAMAGTKLAAQLEARVGSPIMLVRSSEKKPLVIKGLVEAGDANDNILLVNLSLAQSWLGREGRISHALLRVGRTPGEVDAWIAAVSRDHPDLDIRPIRRISAGEGRVLEKIQGLMGLTTIVILLLSTFCVNTTLTALVGERAREFALQKALGARNQSIVGQVLSETGVIAVCAVLAGLLLGFLLAQLLGQAIFSATIDFRLPVFPLTAILSLLVALVAAIVPVCRVTQIEPARILKGESL